MRSYSAKLPSIKKGRKGAQQTLTQSRRVAQNPNIWNETPNLGSFCQNCENSPIPSCIFTPLWLSARDLCHHVHFCEPRRSGSSRRPGLHFVSPWASAAKGRAAIGSAAASTPALPKAAVITSRDQHVWRAVRVWPLSYLFVGVVRAGFLSLTTGPPPVSSMTSISSPKLGAAYGRWRGSRPFSYLSFL
jgi:hypothetical protein